jgi:hypothetical protein
VLLGYRNPSGFKQGKMAKSTNMDTETAASTPQNGIPVVEMKIGCRLKVKKFADDEYSWRMSSKLALVPSVGARGPCHLDAAYLANGWRASFS